ncbi:E3 ubiquitin-protein ligase TRIM33-like [Mytilus californianus]|uniref:E3 ubiquitin-protein ligase TRIM33-like n=1 Tax=Mytilus californianus TaxID=6549 RepID=UPI0022462034|nr:E3 ubiquitin-protein ligase TRIM33-like [Mytilus californianus]
MTSSERFFCTLCYDDCISRDAVTWCTECEVFLCTDCEKHHKKLRMSKDHKCMCIKDYKKLPKFIKELSTQCRDHKKKYELYCSLHACPCCVTCVTEKHQKCLEMKPLSDILNQIKFSASVQLLEKDLTDVKKNFEEIIKFVNSRMNISNVQKTKAAEKIRFTRKSIDDFLNKIEQEILDDLETKHSKLKSEMNTLLQQLEQRANQISNLQNEFYEMTRLATELQMFIGLREIEKTSSLAAKYIEELESGDTFDEKNLEVTMSSALHLILQDVKSFGDINIITSQLTLRTKAGRKEQAQYLVKTVPGIEEIKPSMLRTLTIPEDMKSINIYMPVEYYLMVNI